MAFGLGNTTYDDYNAMMNNVDSVFRKLGANRIGDTGKGGDAGTMGEDFLTWKEPMWAALATTMGLKEREAVYQPTFSISELENLTPSSMEVYLGEPNEAHLQAAVKGPFDCRNPYNAPLSKSYELFSTGDRNYLHMEFDSAAPMSTSPTGPVTILPSGMRIPVTRSTVYSGCLVFQTRDTASLV